MQTWLTLLLLSIFFVGCNSGIQEDVKNSTDAREMFLLKGSNSMQTGMNYTILAQGDYPAIAKNQKSIHVYYSDNEADVDAFKEAYVDLMGKEAPSFEGSAIIATMAEKKSGGYRIEVEHVEEKESSVEVDLHFKEATGLATMALTNPYLIMIIPDNHKEVLVSDR